MEEGADQTSAFPAASLSERMKKIPLKQLVIYLPCFRGIISLELTERYFCYLCNKIGTFLLQESPYFLSHKFDLKLFPKPMSYLRQSLN